MFRRQSQFSNVLSYFRAGYGFQDDEFCFGLKNTINDRKFHSFSIFTGSLNITDEVIDDLDPDLLSKRGYVCEAGNDWVCPDGHLKIQDRCYGFVMQNATYIEAEQTCQSIYHGHLARMTTFFHVSIFIVHLKTVLLSFTSILLQKGIGSGNIWSKIEHDQSVLDSR